MTHPKITRPSSRRLLSLDALRGFDMIWICGADTLVHLLSAWTGFNVLLTVSAQLTHEEWAGLRAYDLIFPLFMFLSGVSLSLSLSASRQRQQGQRQFLRKAALRALILILLGIVYNFGWDVSLARFRMASVLGQIGVAYFLAAAVLTQCRSWVPQIAVMVGIGVGVALLQTSVPVPGYGAGTLSPAGSVNSWIDQALLPGRLYGGSYDPEGLLNIVSSASVTLCGALTARLLFAGAAGSFAVRLGLTALLGAALVLAGWLLHPVYPIIKALWTVPFCLVSAGASALLLAAFHLLIDRLEFRRLGWAFAVIGSNSIAIYMAARFLAYPIFAALTPAEGAAPALAAMAGVMGVMLIQWLGLAYCYKRGWFVRV